MSIPNPNPNIEDGKKCDNKTYSSNKIEALIKTATDLPIPEAGDAGKVLTVNSDSDGYELDTIDIPTMGSEVVINDADPFITYRKYGNILFLYINTQNQAYTTDTALGNLPADCTPLMGNRVYRGSGFIACDSENNNRIWARDVGTWTTCTMVLPI